jgi:hypothetical protein
MATESLAPNLRETSPLYSPGSFPGPNPLTLSHLPVEIGTTDDVWSVPGNNPTSAKRVGMSRLSSSPVPFLFLLLCLLFSVSCSDSGTGAGKDLAPLVGTWRAQALVISNKANPSQSFNLIQEGGEFTLSILGSGQYVATLVVFGQPAVEMGTMRASGNSFTITPTSHDGPPTSGTWRFEGEILILDGDTEFDFNQDGTRQAASAHFELFRYTP